jgi:MFS transporter, PPP family, 3-phenylpropionic acid transporter
MTVRFPYTALAAYYFWYFASVGVAVPYLPTWLAASGRRIEEIGWLIGLMTIGRIVAPALWARLADAHSAHVLAIRSASALALLSFLGVPLVTGFTGQALALTLFGCLWSASLPLVESFTLAALADRPEQYTRVRLWGSFGFITAVLVVGAAGVQPGFPWFMLLALCGGLVATLALPEMTLEEPAAGDRPETGDGHWTLRLAGLLLVSVFMQLAHGPYYGFFSVYLARLDYNEASIGLYWAIGVAAEVVLFLWLPRIAGRHAPEGLLVVGALAGVLRFSLVATLAGNPAVLLFAQLLHAGTFGLHHATAVVLVHQTVPRRHAGLAQALYSSLGFGLGGAVGAVASGWLWEHFGPGAAFLGAALASGLAAITALFLARRAHGRSA